MTLDDLGPRLCILGPSNSGKSTLAAAIARKRDVRAVHLDQLHHQPDTDWRPRPAAEFVALHDAVLTGDRWVIDGNYLRCLPQRLARATGVILLDAPIRVSLARYLRRCWFEPERVGGLEGGRDSVNWTMIHYIVVAARTNRKRYAAWFDATALAKVELASPRALDAFYRSERLDR